MTEHVEPTPWEKAHKALVNIMTNRTYPKLLQAFPELDDANRRASALVEFVERNFDKLDELLKKAINLGWNMTRDSLIANCQFIKPSAILLDGLNMTIEQANRLRASGTATPDALAVKKIDEDTSQSGNSHDWKLACLGWAGIILNDGCRKIGIKKSALDFKIFAYEQGENLVSGLKYVFGDGDDLALIMRCREHIFAFVAELNALNMSQEMAEEIIKTGHAPEMPVLAPCSDQNKARNMPDDQRQDAVDVNSEGAESHLSEDSLVGRDLNHILTGHTAENGELNQIREQLVIERAISDLISQADSLHIKILQAVEKAGLFTFLERIEEESEPVRRQFKGTVSYQLLRSRAGYEEMQGKVLLDK